MPDDPRRLLVADLAARLAAGLAGQARAYEAAAGWATGDLRRGLEDLGRAKHTQEADLAPLARALGVPAPLLAPAPAAGTAPGWGVVLGEAFQAERTLEEVGRELAGLTADPAVRALGARLAAAADRDGKEVRKLYLRYS
jgi:hypothetical protein